MPPVTQVTLDWLAAQTTIQKKKLFIADPFVAKYHTNEPVYRNGAVVSHDVCLFQRKISSLRPHAL